MNVVQINDQQISLVFKSGDVIHVDMWAIEEFRFDTVGSSWVFEKGRKEMLNGVQIDNFHLKVNITNERMFWTAHRNYVDSDSIKKNGKQCISQLLKRRDLSILTLNGVDYLLPLKEKTVGENGFERTINELQFVKFEHDNKKKQDYIIIDIWRF